VGRTARAEATGDAITLLSPQEEGDFRSIERAVATRIARVRLPGFGPQPLSRTTVKSSEARKSHSKSSGWSS
jgi:superfamily II DNA/RNA helicase